MLVPIIIGVLSGLISGMGIGGGTILIPALSIFLSVNQHTAQGVNLLYFIPTAIVALWVHIRNKAINFKIAIPILLFGLGGAAGGSFLAAVIQGTLLRKLFGGFLFVMGIYEILKKDRIKDEKHKK